MYGFVIKLFLAAIGTVLIIYMAAQAFRNARRLDKRIQEFKAEQEELEKQGKRLNPYAALAELYAEDVQREEKAAARRANRSRR
jgi:uncharacterized membrane protein (DUF106 family)